MFAKTALKYEPLPLPDRHHLDDGEMRAAASAFYDTMRRRHTVRDFSDRQVPLEVIQSCVRTAGTAPSGANHQPWAFVAISNADIKHRVRLAAEEEEREFYAGGAGDEWIRALEPIGTSASKPHLDIAPWLVWSSRSDGASLTTGRATRTTMCPRASASRPDS